MLWSSQLAVKYKKGCLNTYLAARSHINELIMRLVRENK